LVVGFGSALRQDHTGSSTGVRQQQTASQS
jgi:hypothetical protein